MSTGEVQVSAYRMLIVEDDDAEAAALAAVVERYASERGIAITQVREMVAFSLVELAPDFDVILLDIDLPGINGMEAAEDMRDRGVQTPLIFVTNLAQYAVHGYAVDALDFVVKPVTWGSVSMALDKALRVVSRDCGANIVLRTRDEVAVIARRDLVYVEVRSHDLLYHEAGRDEPALAHGSLSAVERELADGPFVRISSSCLVNMEHIRRVRHDSLLVSDGSELWFSRRKHKAAMECITEFLGTTL